MAIADGSADAALLAADLLSQAEHDPLAQDRAGRHQRRAGFRRAG